MNEIPSCQTSKALRAGQVVVNGYCEQCKLAHWLPMYLCNCDGGKIWIDYQTGYKICEKCKGMGTVKEMTEK